MKDPHGVIVGVFFPGEAAARLGISRTALEGMIDAGRVKALSTQFTRVIPTSEVERLSKA